MNGVPPSKRCTKCHETKPHLEFSAHKDARDGRRSQCKECVNAQTRQGYVRKREPVPAGTKRCCRCKTPVPISSFYPDKHGMHGVGSVCRQCVSATRKAKRLEKPKRALASAEEKRAAKKARDKAYRLSNKEKISRYKRAWAEKNVDHRKRYLREWYESNKSYVSAYYKTRAIANPGGSTERARAWKRANPDRARELARISSLQRRAQKLKSVGSLTQADVFLLVEVSCGLCAYCLERCSKLTVDHVEPLSKGGAHDVSNVVMACLSCNLRKSANGVLSMIYLMNAKNVQTQ